MLVTLVRRAKKYEFPFRKPAVNRNLIPGTAFKPIDRDRQYPCRERTPGGRSNSVDGVSLGK
jgi:hypothetical protein